MPHFNADRTIGYSLSVEKDGRAQLDFSVVLPKPKLENDGMVAILCDKMIQLKTPVMVSGVRVKPMLSVSVYAEVPVKMQEQVKRHRSLELARAGSPILR